MKTIRLVAAYIILLPLMALAAISDQSSRLSHFIDDMMAGKPFIVKWISLAEKVGGLDFSKF